MATAMDQLEKLALELPEQQRVRLIARLLDSLPSTLIDQDEGVAEALRRDAEMDAPSLRALSLEDIDAAIRNRRK
jgi:putative addiction module component (TIGR02574 family)